MSTLSFKKPATQWREALPIGNGRLGAMVYGGIKKEILALNQDSIWYGGPINRINPDAYTHLEDVRKLILKGKIQEAEELLKYNFSGIPQSARTYQPLGTLEMNYKNIQCENVYLEETYQRRLNLDDGMVEEGYHGEDVEVRKSYFSYFTHNVITIHIQSSKPLNMDIYMHRNHFYDHSGKLDKNTIFMDGRLGGDGISFISAVRAETAGGKQKVSGDHIVISEARVITLYLACETTFYEKNPEKRLEYILQRASEDGYEKVQERHLADYHNLFQRVNLHIDTGDEEGEFAETYYQFGRYLLLSSSRPGSLPANLQGIWNDSMEPPWDSKFTININTEMNYWPAEMCGLSECHLPLFQHLLRMWKNGKRVAREMYGCRGFVAHHNTDIWGDCAPQDIYSPATYWVMGGAWLCTHIWNHYIYTNDIDFLEKMYPVLRDAVLFFEDFLIEENGQLLTCPSVSPENTYILPSGVSGRVCAGPTMDNQILRDLLEDYVKASARLGASDEILEKSKEILPQLLPNRTGKYGQIMEWREDYEEMEPGHRHISQLYALHPSHQITPDKTKELAEAARKTLERRLQYGGGHTGWSCAWIANFYARLLDGDKALENLNKLWKHSTFPNLMDTHPRKDDFVFQIDGNLGALACMTEMLVQSDEDRTILLPALPRKWKNGCIRGIRIVGGARLDMEWKDGLLTDYVLHSDYDYDVKIIYRGSEKTVHLKAGI